MEYIKKFIQDDYIYALYGIDIIKLILIWNNKTLSFFNSFLNFDFSQLEFQLNQILSSFIVQDLPQNITPLHYWLLKLSDLEIQFAPIAKSNSFKKSNKWFNKDTWINKNTGIPSWKSDSDKTEWDYSQKSQNIYLDEIGNLSIIHDSDESIERYKKNDESMYRKSDESIERYKKRPVNPSYNSFDSTRSSTSSIMNDIFVDGNKSKGKRSSISPNKRLPITKGVDQEEYFSGRPRNDTLKSSRAVEDLRPTSNVMDEVFKKDSGSKKSRFRNGSYTDFFAQPNKR